MKKLFLFLIILTAGVNGFAQSQQSVTNSLQGTWELIGLLDDEDSFNEQDLKAENFVALYIFSNNVLNINNMGEIIGPVNFEHAGAYLKLSSGNGYSYHLPYSLHGNILIIHEGGYAFIYRKR